MNVLKLIKISILSLAIGTLSGVSLSFAISYTGPDFGSRGTTALETGYLDLIDDDISQTVYCPDTDAWHTHGYENTTGPTEGIEYYMAVTKFRIYLHDDFMENVDLDSMECALPSGYYNCDGTSRSELGGTTINVVTGDTSSDAVYENYIEYEFGKTTSSDKPIAPGYNDYNYDGTIDTDSDDRTVYTTVDFEFDENVETGDSATTTSAIYVQFWAYDEEGCGDWEDSACWEAIEEDGETDKHWNNHTNTITTNYECEELTCESLVITPETGDLTMNDVFSDVAFTVTATGSDGSDITNDSEFTYSINKYGSANDASNADGYLRYGLGNAFRSKNPTTSDSSVTFQDTEPGDTLYVYVSDYEGVSYEGTACEVEVELPYCTDLDITDPTGWFGSSYLGTFNDEYSGNIDIDTDTSTGESWPFNVTYESTDSTATFDGSTSPYTTTDHSIASYISTDSATVNVELDDQNGDGESDDVAGLCNDSFYYTVIPDIPEIPACESLEFTTSSPITAEVMEAGNVEISWESYLSDGTPNPSTYFCTSSNPAGTFTEPSGRSSTASITTTFTTVYYTGEPGDSITCQSYLPYSSATCVDTLISETTTDTPVCTDLELDDPYIENESGATVNIDLSNESDLETLYADNTVCFDFEVTTETGFTGTLQATGYTDSSRSTLTSGLINLNVDGGGSYVGNPATVGIGGATTYTGTLCWENYDENYFLNLEVVSESVCQDSVTLPPVSENPPDDDGDDDGGGGDNDGDDDNEYTCDDVVDVNDTENDDCDEYSMEVCVEDDDIVVVSDGDEICYYEESDGDHSDPIACEDDELEIEGDNTRECYDVVIEGNVCEGDLEVIYPNSDEEPNEVCWEDSPEEDVIGEVNKFIYTFNFISEKAHNSEEEIFFSHDEDRVFYTLEYTPAGSEDEITFTDDLWGSNIDGTLGESGEDSGGWVYLISDLSTLQQYEYSVIKAFGFGADFEENSETLASEISSNNDSGNFMSFVPYLKYEDGRESTAIPACPGSSSEEADETEEVDYVCYNPEYTPESDGRVVLENVDTVEDATIRIRYIGVIASGIKDSCDEDRDGECLTELFVNEGTVHSGSESVSDSATLVVICSYLMTTNGGDIYLEGDLNSGSDISCAYIDEDTNYSSYSNTDGLVILDTGDDDDDDNSSSSSSDSDTDLSTISADEASVCDNESDNLIGNISSYVCEIVSAVSELWKESTVSSTTDNHLSQATRNVSTMQSRTSYSSWTELEELKNLNNPDSGILYFDASDADITLRTLTVPCGAWTLIVEGGHNLVLAGDIQYETNCSAQNLASVAFVVTGGDIYIKSSSYHLVGVYYTNQSFNGDHRSAVNGKLEIQGSLYGDVQALLDAADYVGPPTLDGGSIVVSYDSRILLNTPPALSEYVDVNTEKGVN